ncbi:MAG: UvrB/UvrC motif-containing protein [Acutalibacteraceae bacterium]
MLCQNCNKNDANMHMKRIINGRAAEVHLCSDCARSLGYGEAFSGVGLGFSNVLSDLFLNSSDRSADSVRCSGCGKTFEEIAEDGKIGCAECYATFYDKLLPTLNRIHGKVGYIGKKPFKDGELYNQLSVLKSKLENAVANRNYELAAKLRDEIISVSQNGGADL